METTPATIWDWAEKGVRGAVAICQGLVDQQCPISGHHMEKLEKYHAQLTEIIARAKRPDYTPG